MQIVGVVGKALVKSLLKIVTATASEAFMTWLLFYVADRLVKSTKTSADDEFLAEVKKAYQKAKERDEVSNV